jgi:LacI family transcriptional regulator
LQSCQGLKLDTDPGGIVSALTLRDLARKLEISTGTVSRALSGDPAIALKTRARVAEAARTFGYVPNVAARQLVSGRSGFAAFVMPVRGPDFIDSYLGEFLTGLGEGLIDHRMHLFIATVPQGTSELDVLRHVVESRRADGVVVPRLGERDERVAYLLDRGVPFVAHGRLLGPEGTHAWLDTDGETAFGEAFDLLYDLGHRHFGLISIADRMTFRHHREQGLRAAIARRGDLSVRLDVVSAPRFDRVKTAEAIDSLLHAPERPTAMLGLFDELALAVLEQTARAGLSVPDDLSVVGFDNIPAAAYVSPGLTTFDTRTRDMAREIAGMLATMIAAPPESPPTRLTAPVLVPRGSHGPAPVTGTN